MSKAFNHHQETVGKTHIDRLKQEAALAATIKTERQRQGLSQQELANAIGKPKSTIGRIEAGITIPRVDTLLAIAQVLHISFSIGETSTNKNNRISL